MLFNSLEFLVFLPAVTAVYFVSPQRYRWLVLLAASCYFYMAFLPAYILLLAFTIVVDYFASLAIAGASSKRTKNVFLWMGLGANLAVLGFFKYYNFLNDSFATVFGWAGLAYGMPGVEILLPIGLSFHTFQAMSYVVDVYRGEQAPERHLGIFAVYVMFFPQLVAGPIERSQNLLPQFRENHRFSLEGAVEGSRLMLLGFVKKIVVADRLAVTVDRVYSEPTEHTAPALAFATLCFAFQIYCDFSGYTDIARGAARIMGFRLMLNFRRPYLARSIGEFWRRWHISLSSWFRDYVYIPLGGSRRGFARVQVNLMITFLISGLWHGASWTFVIWGGINGLYLIVENITTRQRERVRSALRVDSWPALLRAYPIAVVLFLSCLAWVFFRANNVADGFHVVWTIATSPGDLVSPGAIAESFRKAGLSTRSLVLSAGLMVAMFGFDALSEHLGDRALAARPRWLRWGLYYAGLAALTFVGKFGEEQFIYFQF